MGAATRARGYMRGRTLREGCLTPGVGGGLCQLSNALYQAAIDSGFTITERHLHSAIIPGSAAEADRDATVAFNYIDLRFVPDRQVRLKVYMSSTDLVVQFRGRPLDASNDVMNHAVESTRKPRLVLNVVDHSCVTCGQVECTAHRAIVGAKSDVWRTAFLVNEKSPEIEQYVRQAHGNLDTLGVPIDGARRLLAGHRWDTTGFGGVGDAWLETAYRSAMSRRLGHYGARRLASAMASTQARLPGALAG